MIPTLKLSDIAGKWRDALQDNAAIQNYCSAKYGKQPKFYVGFSGKNPPADTDCPYIIIYPGAKSEGLELQEYTYKITVGWAIVQEGATVTNDTTEYTGVAECDALGQLIYLALAGLSAANPVSTVNYVLEPAVYYPRFAGRMDVMLKITSVNGYSIDY